MLSSSDFLISCHISAFSGISASLNTKMRYLMVDEQKEECISRLLGRIENPSLLTTASWCQTAILRVNFSIPLSHSWWILIIYCTLFQISPVQMENHALTIQYHLHQCQPLSTLRDISCLISWHLHVTTMQTLMKYNLKRHFSWVFTFCQLTCLSISRTKTVK